MCTLVLASQELLEAQVQRIHTEFRSPGTSQRLFPLCEAQPVGTLALVLGWLDKESGLTMLADLCTNEPHFVQSGQVGAPGQVERVDRILARTGRSS